MLLRRIANRLLYTRPQIIVLGGTKQDQGYAEVFCLLKDWDKVAA